MEEGHYVEKDLDDQFSSKAFDTYIEILDPYRRYFLDSDIKKFEKFRFEIDDQFKNYDLSFFNLTHEVLVKRIQDSKNIYTEVLEKPFNYKIDEILKISTDENFVISKSDLKERWRKTFKYYTLNNLNDLITLLPMQVSFEGKITLLE